MATANIRTIRLLPVASAVISFASAPLRQPNSASMVVALLIGGSVDRHMLDRRRGRRQSPLVYLGGGGEQPMRKRISAVARRQGVDEHKKLIEFARSARWWIWVAATVITLGFAWLQLRDTDITKLMRSMGADAIWRTALVLYFSSWVWGCQFDVDIQEEVLTSSGNRRAREWGVIGFVAGITIFGAVLVWAEGNIMRFSVALAVFSVVDHTAGRYLAQFMQAPFEVSAQYYRERRERFNLERLNAVRNMVYGPWKLWRLIVVVPLILLMLADAFFRPVSDALSAGVRAIAPEVGADAGSMVGGILALVFVLSAELWIWRMRVNTKVAISVLDGLARRFRLQPIGSKPASPSDLAIQAQ
jgi:hypothetical protein